MKNYLGSKSQLITRILRKKYFVWMNDGFEKSIHNVKLFKYFIKVSFLPQYERHESLKLDNLWYKGKLIFFI